MRRVSLVVRMHSGTCSRDDKGLGVAAGHHGLVGRRGLAVDVRPALRPRLPAIVRLLLFGKNTPTKKKNNELCVLAKRTPLSLAYVDAVDGQRLVGVDGQQDVVDARLLIKGFLPARNHGKSNKHT